MPVRRFPPNVLRGLLFCAACAGMQMSLRHCLSLVGGLVGSGVLVRLRGKCPEFRNRVPPRDQGTNGS
jgi:hypothetical protein